MSNEKQAFPNSYHGEEHKGMTLRDYFAAKAVPTLAQYYSESDLSLKAYKIADEMMKAREHGNS